MMSLRSRLSVICLLFSVFFLSGCASFFSQHAVYQRARSSFVLPAGEETFHLNYCPDCYWIHHFQGTSYDLLKQLNCPPEPFFVLNPHLSENSLVDEGEVLRLPPTCLIAVRSHRLVLQPLAVSLSEKKEIRGSFPLILKDNACRVSVTKNRYTFFLLPLFCPTQSIPLSLKKHTDGGVIIYTQPTDKIVAAAAGRVFFASPSLKKYGNLIVIRHCDGYTTIYEHTGAHLVHFGQYVQVGQPIAYPSCANGRCRFVFATRFYGHLLPLHLSIDHQKIAKSENNLKIQKVLLIPTTLPNHAVKSKKPTPKRHHLRKKAKKNISRYVKKSSKLPRAQRKAPKRGTPKNKKKLSSGVERK